METVIYKLFLKEKSNLVYIGSTTNPVTRLKTHIRLLKKGTHFNTIFQHIYNQCSEKDLIFEIVERCSKEVRFLREYEIIMADERSINIFRGEKQFGDVFKFLPNKEEVVRKITETVRLRFQNMTQEEKVYLSSKMEKNPNWKGGLCYCKCGKNKASSAKTCGSCRDRSGNKNPFFGKRHPPELIAQIAAKNKGKLPPNTKKVSVCGVVYESATSASKALNCTVATVLNRIKSNPENYKFHS